MGSRLKVALPVFRNAQLCEPVPAVNGIGRNGCGLLFRTGGGAGQFGSVVTGDASWFGIGRSAQFGAYYPNARSYSNPGGTAVSGTCEALVLASRPGLLTGYFQVATQYSDAAAIPALTLKAPGAVLEANYDHLSASFGNTLYRIIGTFPASGAGQQTPANGGCAWGMEIRPGDLAVRLWGDAGVGDPRITGGGIFSAPGIPMLLYLTARNDFGYQTNCGFSEVIATKQHAVPINVPAARSVRITINGVVQTFVSAQPYLSLPGGVGSFDPAPGLFFPMMAARFEFFTVDALGGVLIADLTIAKLWGGDSIGLV